MLSRSYFSKIRPLPQKHCALMPFFSIFSWKSPICHAHICSKKREFCQNYTILWAKNVNRILFFFRFFKKKSQFSSHILSTERPFSKRTLLQCPCFDKKTFILLKTPCSHVICFNFSWKTQSCHAHIWSKNVNFVQTILYYGPKKSIGCLLFQFLRININPHAHIFSKTTSIIKKKKATLMPIFCQKNVHSLKNSMFSCHLFNFFMKNPCCHALIWSKKRKFCQNYIILWDK